MGGRAAAARAPASPSCRTTSTRSASASTAGCNLIQLYGVYTEVDCIFDTRNVMAIWERVPAPRSARHFPFDPALYDWDHYFQDVHFPTVVRMSRAETVERKGKQPTGSTAVRAGVELGARGHRAAQGPSDVLAVFDVDGTLVETNVVEYFLWMRLRAQPARRLAARLWRRCCARRPDGSTSSDARARNFSAASTASTTASTTR